MCVPTLGFHTASRAPTGQPGRGLVWDTSFQSIDSGVKTAWVQILAESLTSCGILGKPLNLSVK